MDANIKNQKKPRDVGAAANSQKYKTIVWQDADEWNRVGQLIKDEIGYQFIYDQMEWLVPVWLAEKPHENGWNLYQKTKDTSQKGVTLTLTIYAMLLVDIEATKQRDRRNSLSLGLYLRGVVRWYGQLSEVERQRIVKKYGDKIGARILVESLSDK